jgi:GTP-binding protein HflX
MNLISKSEVFAENKLFATLDTTVRKVVMQNLPFLLSPTRLDLFASYLINWWRVLKAHLMKCARRISWLHVVDISHPDFEDHIRVVNETLVEIGARDKPSDYGF